MRKVQIPPIFILPPFSNNDEIIVNEKISFKEGCSLHPFIFDLYEKLNINSLKPWKDKHKYIPLLLKRWDEKEPEIAQLYEIRDRHSALKPMKEMISVYLTFLFWINEQPVHGLTHIKSDIEKLSVKPVNASERVEFIISNPNQYHAFIQLQQLFVELKKKYAVVKLKNN